MDLENKIGAHNDELKSSFNLEFNYGIVNVVIAIQRYSFSSVRQKKQHPWGHLIAHFRNVSHPTFTN